MSKCCCMTQKNAHCRNPNKSESSYCWVHRARCKSPIPRCESPIPLKSKTKRRKRESNAWIPEDALFIFDALRDQKICSIHCALTAEAIAWYLRHPARTPTKEELHTLNGELAAEARVIKAYLNILSEKGSVRHAKAVNGAGVQGWNKGLFNSGEDVYWKEKKLVDGKIKKIKDCDCRITQT